MEHLGNGTRSPLCSLFYSILKTAKDYRLSVCFLSYVVSICSTDS